MNIFWKKLKSSKTIIIQVHKYMLKHKSITIPSKFRNRLIKKKKILRIVSRKLVFHSQQRKCYHNKERSRPKQRKAQHMFVKMERDGCVCWKGTNIFRFFSQNAQIRKLFYLKNVSLATFLDFPLSRDLNRKQFGPTFRVSLKFRHRENVCIICEFFL